MSSNMGGGDSGGKQFGHRARARSVRAPGVQEKAEKPVADNTFTTI